MTRLLQNTRRLQILSAVLSADWSRRFRSISRIRQAVSQRPSYAVSANAIRSIPARIRANSSAFRWLSWGWGDTRALLLLALWPLVGARRRRPIGWGMCGGCSPALGWLFAAYLTARRVVRHPRHLHLVRVAGDGYDRHRARLDPGARARGTRGGICKTGANFASAPVRSIHFLEFCPVLRGQRLVPRFRPQNLFPDPVALGRNLEQLVLRDVYSIDSSRLMTRGGTRRT